MVFLFLVLRPRIITPYAISATKFKVHLSESPNVGILNTTAKREQHAHSDEIVQQYNTMSTQVVSGAVTSGGREIPETSTHAQYAGFAVSCKSIAVSLAN